MPPPAHKDKTVSRKTDKIRCPYTAKKIISLCDGQNAKNMKKYIPQPRISYAQVKKTRHIAVG